MNNEEKLLLYQISYWELLRKKEYNTIFLSHSANCPLVTASVDFRAAALPPSSLRTGHQRLHFDADAHLDRHRPLLRDNLPVPAAHEDVDVRGHHRLHLVVLAAGDAALRHLHVAQQQGRQRRLLLLRGGLVHGELPQSVRRLQRHGAVRGALLHHHLLLRQGLAQAQRSS